MDAEYLAEKQKLFREKLEDGNVYINGRLLKGSLTPYLMSVEKYAKLSASSELVCGALEKFLRLYVDSSEVQALFPEVGNYRDLTTFRPSSKHWIHYARFDLIESEGGDFKILETNTASPVFMAPTYCSKIYEGMGLLPHFLGPNMEVVKQPMDEPDAMGKSLMALSSEVLGKEFPNVAVISSEPNRVKSDSDLIEVGIKGMGLNCPFALANKLTLGNNGQVYAGEMAIDVGFLKIDKAVNPGGQATCFGYDSCEEDAPFLRGLRERKFVIANNFVSCLVAESKKILAMIKRPEFQELFSREEQEAIRELVPETYSFDSTNQELFLEKVDDFIQNKCEWVIKSSLDARGRAVWPGQSCPVDMWAELVRKLRDGPFVIQKFIKQTPTLVYNDAVQPELKPMNLVVCLHILRGKASGIVAKAAENCVVNINIDAVRPPAYVVRQKLDG